MIKVLFYTQNRWAYGSIHHALCKELYKYGIYANLLDWTQPYSLDEFELLNSIYDIFVTNPEAVLALHYNYGIPLEKIITIAHGQWDILLAKRDSGTEFFKYVKKYAVVSKILKRKSKEFEIEVEPEVVRVGIHFDTFYSAPSPVLKIIGYGGAKETINFFGEEIKRGRLVEDCINSIQDVELITHGFYNHLCMPGYYKGIDALIMSSTEESVGLPIMEAAAAGKLTMGTPVGYFENNGKRGGGLLLGLEENQFKNDLIESINFYKDNPKEYIDACLSIQQFAKENYDWEVVIEDWVKLLSV